MCRLTKTRPLWLSSVSVLFSSGTVAYCRYVNHKQRALCVIPILFLSRLTAIEANKDVQTQFYVREVVYSADNSLETRVLITLIKTQWSTFLLRTKTVINGGLIKVLSSPDIRATPSGPVPRNIIIITVDCLAPTAPWTVYLTGQWVS